MKHSSSCAGPLRGTTPRCPLGLSTGWILSQGSLFPVTQCSSVNFRVKNGLSFEQRTQCSLDFPFPGSTPPSSNPAPTGQDSNLGLSQQCPVELCRSLLSLLISQGGSKHRQWPCPCHTTMTPGHTARVVFQRRLWSCAVLPGTSPPIGADITGGRHSQSTRRSLLLSKILELQERTVPR